MGDDALVIGKAGELTRLARLLDASEPRPRALVLLPDDDRADRELIVVPNAAEFDLRDEYKKLAATLSQHKDELGAVDLSDLKVVRDSDPVIAALAKLFRVETFSSVSVEKSMIDGVYVPQASILHLAL